MRPTVVANRADGTALRHLYTFAASRKPWSPGLSGSRAPFKNSRRSPRTLIQPARHRRGTETWDAHHPKPDIVVPVVWVVPVAVRGARVVL